MQANDMEIYVALRCRELAHLRLGAWVASLVQLISISSSKTLHNTFHLQSLQQEQNPSIVHLYYHMI